MGLIIEQGMHDATNDGTFKNLISEKEMAKVVGVALNEYIDEALKVTFEIVSEGKLKGKQFDDTVNYNPNHKMSWRYIQLRKRVGHPYVEGENPSIDIESLLMGKVVPVELSERQDKNDPTKYWQQVKYLKLELPGGTGQPEPTPPPVGGQGGTAGTDNW